MAKIIANNGVLYTYHMEIGQLDKSIMKHFFKTQIANFNKHNGIQVKGMLDRVTKLQDAHFIIEDQKIKQELVDGQMMPVMQEGKTMADYTKAYNDLMLTAVEIVV